MPYAPSSTAIVTPDDVEAAQAGGARITLPADADAVGALIEAVSTEVVTHIDRTLVASAYSVVLAWRVAGTGGFRALSPVRPVYALPTGFVLAGTTIVAPVGTDLAAPVALRGGYRRPDQTDAVYEGAPVYPADLTRFVIDAVLYRWNAADLGVGMAESEIDTGAAIVRRRGVRLQWWAENVHRIDSYRLIL